ncbi:MAG: zinc ribbon domain-containing protein [Anaerolineales bacterium]
MKGQLLCPACHTLNSIDAETCTGCGEPLTIFGRVMARQGSQSRSQRLEQMRGRAGAIKEEARKSSDARMATFKEIDHRRFEHEREEIIAQQMRDRRLFRGVAIGLGIFFLIIIVAALVTLL